MKYAFTLNKTMPNLVQNSLQLSWKFKGKLTRSLMNDDADWMGLSFEMPFKTRYHTWKQSRFIIFSFFCENGKNQFTQKFIQLCRRNFSNFNSCFFFCLKELCQQSNAERFFTSENSSFAFPIGYTGFAPCVNLSIYEINYHSFATLRKY